MEALNIVNLFFGMCRLDSAVNGYVKKIKIENYLDIKNEITI